MTERPTMVGSENLAETWVDLLRRRAEETPDATAFIFLEDGESESDRLTFQQLDARARALAGWLGERGSPGDRALLLHPPGLEFLAAYFGCLYAGVVAVPAYPPDPNQKLARLHAVVGDSCAAFVLTDGSLLKRLERERLESEAFSSLEWQATDQVDAAAAESWKPPALTGDSLAFLQYTSGSTGSPKGVMVSHRNLLYNSAMLRDAMRHGEDTVHVTWLPLFHDMGLIGNVLQALYLGTPCIFMPPVAFLRRPMRWLRAIERYRATTSGGPNFAYDLCVRKSTPEEVASLDLSSWTVAFNGAEPVRAATLERFTRTFAAAGFRSEAFFPCFGMAEATLFVTGIPVEEAPSALPLKAEALGEHRVAEAAPDEPCRQVVDCGPTCLEAQVAVVEPESRVRCPADRVGEIWLAGEHIAQGYWRREEETRHTFEAKIEGEDGAWLRTGDLGFVRDGRLYVTGRLKDVVIIRGRNHYPQDLEHTVERSHKALRPGCGAAFSVEEGGEERLVVVQEVQRSVLEELKQRPEAVDRAVEEVVAAARRALSREHELQLFALALLEPGTVPKTSSGKIQRRACREAFLQGRLKAAAAWKAPAVDVEMEEEGAGGVREAGPRLPAEESRRRADELIAWLRDYAPRRLDLRLMDERRTIPPYVVLDLGNRGFMGLGVPVELGGQGLRSGDSLRVLEQLGALDLTLSLFVGLHNVLGLGPLLRFGSEAQVRQLVPSLAAGRELIAFTLTEPGAGSNPRALQARAEALDGSAADAQRSTWHLYGEKVWSGSAGWAGVLLAFARTLDGEGRDLGITAFTVRQGAPGLRQGAEALTLGMRAMVQNTVHLEGVEVTGDDVVGELGRGMEVAQDAMTRGRLAIAATNLGAMKRCVTLALRYARRRQVSTGRLLDNPVARWRLSRSTAAVAALASLVRRMGDLLDQGAQIPADAFAVAKVAGSELLWRTVDDLVQLLGGRGYIESNGVPQILRDARVYRIFEGPTETLEMHLGSSLAGDEVPVLRFLAEDLGSPRTAVRLGQLRQQLISRAEAGEGPFQGSAAQQWAHAQLGRAVVYATLEAASAEGADERPASWARGELEAVARQALEPGPGEGALRSSEELEAEVASYAGSVGWVEARGPGEGRTRDVLLEPVEPAESLEPGEPAETPAEEARKERKERKERKGRVTPRAQTTRVRAASSPAEAAQLEAWMEGWLRRRLRLSKVERTKAFADYGLDSVTAVELVQDLEDHLVAARGGDGPALEPTLVWSFPNVRALAAHIAGTAENGASVADQGVGQETSQEASEEDLARELAAELEAVRKGMGR